MGLNDVVAKKEGLGSIEVLDITNDEQLIGCKLDYGFLMALTSYAVWHGSRWKWGSERISLNRRHWIFNCLEIEAECKDLKLLQEKFSCFWLWFT